MNQDLLEGKRVLEEQLGQVGAQITYSLVENELGAQCLRFSELISCWFHYEQSESWKDLAKILLLHDKRR